MVSVPVSVSESESVSESRMREYPRSKCRLIGFGRRSGGWNDVVGRQVFRSGVQFVGVK